MGQLMLRSIIASVVAMLMTISHVWASDIRRVVTGLDASDRSMAMFDSHVPLTDIQPDLSLGYLWVTDTFPISLSKTDTKEKVIGMSPSEKRNAVRRGRVSAD